MHRFIHCILASTLVFLCLFACQSTPNKTYSGEWQIIEIYQDENPLLTSPVGFNPFFFSQDHQQVTFLYNNENIHADAKYNFNRASLQTISLSNASDARFNGVYTVKLDLSRKPFDEYPEMDQEVYELELRAEHMTIYLYKTKLITKAVD